MGGESDSDSDSDSDLDSDSDEEDMAELVAQLEKVRAEAKARAAREEEEAREARKAELLASAERAGGLGMNDGLMGGGSGGSGGSGGFAISKSFMDDTVFRNQATDMGVKRDEGFVNDTIRNSFHRKFLNKYIG